MKKIIYSFLFAAVLFTTNACKKPLKNEDDYFVKLSTVSATVQTDGSVLVQASIQSPGKAKGSSVQNPGFCLSTNPTPTMLERQLLTTTDGSTFSAVYPASTFSDDSTYYFRAFATNDYGYSYGNVIKLDSVIAPAVTAPCSLTANSVNIGGATPTYTYYSIGAPDSYHFFTASSSGGTVQFQFGSNITTGIYHTTVDSDPGAGEVNVIFYFGFTSGALSSGSNVYVNKLGTNTFDIRICSAPWTSGSSTFQFNTRFITPH